MCDKVTITYHKLSGVFDDNFCFVLKIILFQKLKNKKKFKKLKHENSHKSHLRENNLLQFEIKLR